MGFKYVDTTAVYALCRPLERRELSAAISSHNGCTNGPSEICTQRTFWGKVPQSVP